MTLRKIIKSKFILRAKVIFAGTVIAQLIAFATSFVITGYFTPEDLGLLGTLTALVSIVSGTFSFRSELAIIQEPEDNAPNVFFQSTLLSSICSLIFCIVCFFLPWDFAKIVRENFFPFIFWTWGYFLFFNSKQLPFKFNELILASSGSIFRNGFTFFYQLIGGFLSPTFGWLVSGRVAGDYVGAFVHARKYWHLIDFKKSSTNWLAYLKKYADYIVYMTPHHFCISLSSNIIVFFIESNYGLAVVGFYALSQRLVQAPMDVIGSALFSVTTQRLSELKNSPRELEVFYLKVITLSLGIAAVCGLMIFISIDYLIPILGQKWESTSIVVKCMIPLFIANLFSTPTTYFLRIINRSAFQLFIEVVELVLKLIFLMFYDFDNSNQMILYFGILTLVVSLLKTIVAYILVRKIPS